MVQVLMVGLMIWTGFVTTRWLKWSINYSLALSLPIGMGIITILILAGFVIGVDTRLTVILVGAGTLAFTMWQILEERQTGGQSYLRALLLLALVAAITLIIVRLSGELSIKYTSDSFNYEGIGRVISGIGQLDLRDDAIFRYQLRRDPMMFAVHAYAQSLGEEHFPYIYLAVGAFIPIMIALAISGTAFDNKSGSKSWVVRLAVTAFVLALATGLVWSGHYLLQATVLLPNLTGALFFGASFIVAHRIVILSHAQNPTDNIWRILVTFALLMAFGAIVRSELRYLNLVLILPVVSFVIFSIGWRRAVAWLSIYSVLGYWWFVVRVLLYPNPNAANLSYGNVILDFGSIGLLLVLPPVAKVLWEKLKPSSGYFLIGALLVIATAAFISTDDFVLSMKNMGNLACCGKAIGLWGYYWPLMIALLIVSQVFDFRESRLYVTTVVLGFITWRIVTYTLFRDSGINDWSVLGSGNRVLTLIVPVIAYYVLYVAFRSEDPVNDLART